MLLRDFPGVASRFCKADIGSKEGYLVRIFIGQLANTTPQNGAQKDVGVEDDRRTVGHLLRALPHPLKSRTSSSSESPASANSFSKRSAATRRASRSASVRFLRVGM